MKSAGSVPDSLGDIPHRVAPLSRSCGDVARVSER
jgi:hypothetical protein